MDIDVRDIGNGAPVRYIEDGVTKIGKQSFVSADVYAEAITAFVIVCGDTMLVNRERKTVYLARRSVRPMKGWFIIGGRMLAGEGEVECVQRTFQRETSLAMPAERSQFLSLNRYWWKDREQEPHNMGSDNLAYTFALEPMADELEKIEAHLEPREYDPSIGLVEFDRDMLVAENVHQVILDMYDKVFETLEDAFLKLVRGMMIKGLSRKEMHVLIDRAFSR